MNDDGAKAELEALRRELQETREALTREHTRVLRLEEVMATQGGEAAPAAGPVPEHLVSTLEDLTRAVERMAEERRETRRSLQEITRAITASELRPVHTGTTSRTTAPALAPLPAPVSAAGPQAVQRRLGAAIAVAALAALTRRIIARLNRIAPRADYNWWLHQAPFASVGAHAPGVEQWHWHLEILPRLAEFAGFELATGCHITTMSPTESARRLREA
jgi:galactose-1-phosphate uridylyltransferase